MAGVQLCIVVNSILTGKFFGSDGLAAMSVVSPIYSVFAAIGALIGIGGAIITSHSLGRDDKSEANSRFTCSFAFAIGLSIFATILMLIFQRELLYILGCTDKIYSMSESYATIYTLGGVFTSLFYMPYHFMKLSGQLRAMIILFVGMMIENAILDFIFCIGLGFGFEGIALGIVFSSMLTVLIGMYLLTDSFKFTRKFMNHSQALIKFGTPSMLNQILNFVRFIIMNNLLLVVAGHVGLVIFSVVKTIEALSNTILSGISQATSAFIGMFSQEKDNVSLRYVESYSHKLSLAILIPSVILICIFPDRICDLFGITDSIEQFQTSEAIRIFSLSLIPATICMILTSYYQSAKFARLANFITISRGFLLLLIPAYFLSNEIGINGIWYSFIIASVGTLAILIFGLELYQSYCEFVLDFHDRSRILLLDLKSERDGRFISFTVKSNLDSIVDSVKKIVEFCEQNALDSKEVMLIQLSMEEMLVSIKDHCFDSVADERIDVRILIDESTIILRIRNGGKTFNPIDYYERIKAIDPDEFAMSDALGISMISQAAEEIHYKSTLGINNLAVVINRKEK